MQIGSNQLFLLHLAYKNGYISQIDAVNVYDISSKNKSWKSKLILEKLEFKGLIKKTEEKTGSYNNLSKYVLTEMGKRILIAIAYKGGDAPDE